MTLSGCGSSGDAYVVGCSSIKSGGFNGIDQVPIHIRRKCLFRWENGVFVRRQPRGGISTVQLINRKQQPTERVQIREVSGRKFPQESHLCHKVRCHRLFPSSDIFKCQSLFAGMALDPKGQCERLLAARDTWLEKSGVHKHVPGVLPWQAS